LIWFKFTRIYPVRLTRRTAKMMCL